jgi:hypothetical protein
VKKHLLLGILECLESVLPVEGGGLDTDTGSGDSLNGHWSVLGLDPLGSGGAVGKEEEETDTENHGDSSEDVEDQLRYQPR